MFAQQHFMRMFVNYGALKSNIQWTYIYAYKHLYEYEFQNIHTRQIVYTQFIDKKKKK